MNEIIFLVGFIVFIAAILVVDMLVIDRKAHVVSIKEAGTWFAILGLRAMFFLLAAIAVLIVSIGASLMIPQKKL